MSKRYRVAFKEILCGKKAGAFYNSGFARDQSSFMRDETSFRRNGSTNNNNLSSSNVRYSRVHSVSLIEYLVLFHLDIDFL